MSGFFNSLKNLASGAGNVTSSIKYEAKDIEEDSQVAKPINIQPLSDENSFTEWLDAMKMVARLSDGIPHEFRKKLWLMLADRYLAERGIDWKKAEKICFNDWTSADDEEFNTQIVKDLHRTGCSLFCGASGRDNQRVLRRVLLGFARWNKSVGYCQGLNVLAAFILQVTDRAETSAVKIMIHLVEGVLPEGYFADNLRGLSVDMAVFRDLLRLKLPKLSKHIDSLQNNNKNKATGSSYDPPLINVFTMQWFLTIFCHCLPKNTVLRIWDLIFLEGNEILLKTALAIWKGISDRIISVTSADEFYSIMGVLTREMLEFTDPNNLIKAIVTIGTLHEVAELREKHRYNITPWTRILSGDDDSSTNYTEGLPVAALTVGVQRRIKKDVGDSEPEYVKSLNDNLISISSEKKQNTDSDSSSTELCDEPEHLSDSEDQPSLPDNIMEFNSGKELQLDEILVKGTSNRIPFDIEEDLLIDTQGKYRNQQSMEDKYSLSVVQSTDGIRRLPEDSDDFITTNTLISNDNSCTEGDEDLRFIHKDLRVHQKSFLGNTTQDKPGLNYLSPNSSIIKKCYESCVNNTVICENYNNTSENLFNDAIIDGCEQLDSSLNPLNIKSFSKHHSSESIISSTDSELDNFLTDYRIGMKTNNGTEPVNDLSMIISNEVSMPSNIADQIVMFTDLKLLTNEITEPSQKYNTVLREKNILQHEQCGDEMISNNLLYFNKDEKYNNKTIDTKLVKSDNITRSEPNIFHCTESFPTKIKQDFHSSEYHSINKKAQTVQLILTDSNNEHSKVNIDLSSFENNSRLKLNKYTPSSPVASDILKQALNLNPDKLIVESSSNSSDDRITAKYPEKSLESKLRSLIVTNGFEYSTNYNLQRNVVNTSPKVASTNSPFCPILDFHEKSSPLNHDVQFENNSNHLNNVLPEKLTESFNKYSESHIYDENMILPFSQSVDTRPTVNLHVDCFHSGVVNESRFVNLKKEFVEFKSKLCNEKLRNKESCRVDLDENNVDFEKLANEIFTNTMFISKRKSNHYSTDLNTLSYNKKDYSLSNSCRLDSPEQRSNFKKKPCELKLYTSTQELLKSKDTLNRILEDLDNEESQSTKLINTTNILTTKKVLTERNDPINFKDISRNSYDSLENQYRGYKFGIPDVNISTNDCNDFVSDSNIQSNLANDSILTKYTKDRENGEKNQKVESKLGVWTKVRPRKKSNGRRSSCDKASKIMQENSAILQKILTCQTKKYLPDLEEISNKITISPINEEISKIFSPILDQIAFNEHEINKELEEIHLNEFYGMNASKEPEYDANNIEYFNLPLTDNKIFHDDRNKVITTTYLHSEETLIDHEYDMDKKISTFSHNSIPQSSNTSCFLKEFPRITSDGVGIIDVYNGQSNECFYQFPKNLDRTDNYDFFQNTNNTSKQFSKCINRLQKYHIESTSPQTEMVFLKSDIDIHHELEKLDKISSHITARSFSPKTNTIESFIDSEDLISDECSDEFNRIYDSLYSGGTRSSNKFVSHQLSKNIPLQISCKQFSNTLNKSLKSSFDLNDENVKSSNNCASKSEHEILLEDSFAFHVHYENGSPHRHRGCDEIFSSQSPNTDLFCTNRETFKYSNGTSITADELPNANRNKTLVSSIISPPRHTHHESNIYLRNSTLTPPTRYLHEEPFTNNCTERSEKFL